MRATIKPSNLRSLILLVGNLRPELLAVTLRFKPCAPPKTNPKTQFPNQIPPPMLQHVLLSLISMVQRYAPFLYLSLSVSMYAHISVRWDSDMSFHADMKTNYARLMIYDLHIWRNNRGHSVWGFFFRKFPSWNSCHSLCLPGSRVLRSWNFRIWNCLIHMLMSWWIWKPWKNGAWSSGLFVGVVHMWATWTC